MLGQVENPMVIDSLWRDFKQEPDVIGECAGCEEGIHEGEDVLEFMDVDSETVMVHQNSDCTYQYVSNMAVCKVAGE